MKKDPKKIGLAIIGAGRVGLIRAELAARHPSVGWIGIAEINPERGEIVREKCGGDFVTTDYKELLARPEVNAVVVVTDLARLVGRCLAACARPCGAGTRRKQRRSPGHEHCGGVAFCDHHGIGRGCGH